MGRHRWRLLAVVFAVLAVTPSVGSQAVAVTGEDHSETDVTILFFGNSHTRANDLPAVVAELVEGAPGVASVDYEVAPGHQFLDDRLGDPVSLELLGSRRWSHVVLQAQRYSSSGTVEYSTAEAEEWVRLVREIGAVPILFPEWPRRGVDETDRVFDLHTGIAEAEPACVPPIPQAFDLAQATAPELVLHAVDGNHSSPAGALLAAMVIAHTITGQPPSQMPDLPGVEIEPDTQALLRIAATDSIEHTSPCELGGASGPSGPDAPPSSLAVGGRACSQARAGAKQTKTLSPTSSVGPPASLHPQR